MAMTSQYFDMVNFFWRCFVSLGKFSYWSKFHVNIISGSGVMAIYFYKGLTRHSGIGNTPVWVLPNIWRLARVRITKFGTNVSDKCYWILQNARVTALIVYFLRDNQQGVKITPTQIKVNLPKNALIIW